MTRLDPEEYPRIGTAIRAAYDLLWEDQAIYRGHGLLLEATPGGWRLVASGDEGAGVTLRKSDRLLAFKALDVWQLADEIERLLGDVSPI